MSNTASKSVFTVIGCMSGSSLDGLDLALCRFEQNELSWRFECLQSDTITYNAQFAARFIRGMHGSALELARLDRDLGKFIGQSAAQLALDHKVDLIASHGHTIFHKPEEGLTLQIGSGAEIAGETGIVTLCDFRTLDVALAGQGAPLVPVGEAALFPDFDVFLNLGGIANVSVHGNRVQGYDVCVCNQLLNALAMEKQLDYDKGGDLARSGQVDHGLLENLNAMPFYPLPAPKSLGREAFEEDIRPLFEASEASVEDKLSTAVEHMAVQIAKALGDSGTSSVLVTGGGAFNDFLLERLRVHCPNELALPAPDIISYKEAIIFAFLGLLRHLGLPNTLASVTGAQLDSSGACIYLPPSTIQG